MTSELVTQLEALAEHLSFDHDGLPLGTKRQLVAFAAEAERTGWRHPETLCR